MNNILTTLTSAASIATLKFYNLYNIKADADDLTQDLYLKLYEANKRNDTDYTTLPFGVLVGFAKRILIDQYLRSAHMTRNCTTELTFSFLSETLEDEAPAVKKDWTDPEVKEAWAELAPRSKASIKRIADRYYDKYPEYVHEVLDSLK